MKVGDLGNELEASQRECRNYNSEVFRLRAGWEEVNEQLDAVKRENKNLAEEIKDLLDQLGEGGRSIHELDKQRRRLEIEKEELQAALEEAEATLEQEENKVVRAQLELSQIRQEIDRRIQEKEEEFENTRFVTLFYTDYCYSHHKMSGKTRLELWTACRPPLRQRRELRQKLSESRRRLRLRSTS